MVATTRGEQILASFQFVDIVAAPVYSSERRFENSINFLAAVAQVSRRRRRRSQEGDGKVRRTLGLLGPPPSDRQREREREFVAGRDAARAKKEETRSRRNWSLNAQCRLVCCMIYELPREPRLIALARDRTHNR